MEEKTMEIPCLSLTALYFGCTLGIDVFNHARQGGLHLEGLETTDCWFRVFTSMLGTVEVNSWNAMRTFEAGHDTMLHRQFTENLAMQLTGFSPTAETAGSSSSGKKRKKEGDSQPLQHTILKLGDTAYFRKKARSAGKEGKSHTAHNRCTLCGALTTYYCKECSAVAGSRFMNLCGPHGGRQCISQHIQTALMGTAEEED